MRTVIIIFTFLFVTSFLSAQDSTKVPVFTEHDSLKVAELQNDIENYKGLNNQNETWFNEAYRKYNDTKDDIVLLFTKANNELKPLLDKKKAYEEELKKKTKAKSEKK